MDGDRLELKRGDSEVRTWGCDADSKDKDENDGHRTNATGD